MLHLASFDSSARHTQISRMNVRCSLLILAVNLWLDESRFVLSHEYTGYNGAFFGKDSPAMYIWHQTIKSFS
jgi:hypothetical protein